MSETMFPRAIVEQYAIEGFARGWSEALDAAREAVAALDVPADWIGSTRHGLDNALAAIDALKEKP